MNFFKKVGLALFLLLGVSSLASATQTIGPQQTFGFEAAGPGLKVNHYLSAAGTNSTSVTTTNTTLYDINLINTTATIEYLKLYNSATAPTCGTTAVYQTIQIPASTQTRVILSDQYGANYANGLGFCITAAYGDSDTTAAAAGIVVDFLHN